MHAVDEIEVMEGSVASHLIHSHKDFNLILQESIKNTPWWGVSAAFHIIFILIAITLFTEPPQSEKTTYIGPIKFDVPVVKEDIEPPKTFMEKTKKIDTKEQEQVDETHLMEKPEEVSEKPETDNDSDKDEVFGELEWSNTLHDPMIGLASSRLGPKGDGGDRNRWKQGPRVLSIAPSKAVPESIDNGLIWLAKHQNENGSWGAKSFRNQCSMRGCEGFGQDDFDIGLTGLALLAFTGSNYSPGSTNKYQGIRFGEVVTKAALFLKNIQKENGMYGDSTMLKFMYNQGIASYAMADLYCIMKEKGEPAAVSFRETALKGIQFVMDAQNDGKAWRYKPKGGDNDVSVTGWCMMALKAGEEAGLVKIPESVWDGVKSHFDDVTDLNYGGVGYQEKGNIAILSTEKDKFERGEMYMPPSLTAIGIMCRIFMGQKRTEAVISNSASIFILGDNLPKWDIEKYGKIDYYYWFYTTYALNQFDGPKGPVWSKWEKEMLSTIIGAQNKKNGECKYGSWEPLDRWCSEGGRVYATAINILTIEVYYRLRIVPSGK